MAKSTSAVAGASVRRMALKENMLAQSYAEAMALKGYLRKATGKDFSVTPVLVFSSAFVKVRGKAKGVEVSRRTT